MTDPAPSGFDASKIPVLGRVLGWVEGAKEDVQNLTTGVEFLNNNPEIAKLVKEHPELADIAKKDTPLMEKIQLGLEGLMAYLEDMFKPLMDNLKGAFGSLSQTLSSSAPQQPAAPMQVQVMNASPAPAVTVATLPAHVYVQVADATQNVVVLNNAGSSVAPGVKQQQTGQSRGATG